VQSTEGKTYLLRYDEETDEWTMQSGFDGDELLVRPSIELLTVNANVIRRAENEIEACEVFTIVLNCCEISPVVFSHHVFSVTLPYGQYARTAKRPHGMCFL